jgi:glutamine amidotransferase
MCELLGMSSRHPATLRYSLEEFSRHGGLAGPHKDGWGIAHYLDGDVRVMKEAAPASDSACVRFLQEHPVASDCVIAHIRKATQGDRSLRNCQPFLRELGGAMHVFAHNGDLEPGRLRARLPLSHARPVGQSDSEYAFCALLARLEDLWRRSSAPPPLLERLDAIEAFARELRSCGPANFLYADGDALFAHGHRRTQASGGIRPPGLHMLMRKCAHPGGTFDTAGLAIRSDAAEQHVAIFSSVRLTSEGGWRPLEEGQVVAVRGGDLVAERFAPELTPLAVASDEAAAVS